MKKIILLLPLVLLLTGCNADITYEEGRQEGYNSGYEEGHSDGYDEGYSAGLEDGKYEMEAYGEKRYESGYEDASDKYAGDYDHGFEDGILEGYDEAESDINEAISMGCYDFKNNEVDWDKYYDKLGIEFDN